ncbi:MAG TPA: cyclodeaminase/cyclohydrolase family protein, partial [Elusimicrobiales bacterium]|nr:cyclodeaminase/cyclohydrolase family protein [Elusimicrobiales bacterium]
AMACAISLKSKKLDQAKRPSLEKALSELAELRAQAQNCAAEDSRSYEMFVEAKGLPKEDPQRPRRMQDALRYAAEVPLKTAKVAHDAKKILGAVEKDVIGAVSSDFHSAGYLLEAGFKCAAENVRINLPSLEDRPEAARLERELAALS